MNERVNLPAAVPTPPAPQAITTVGIFSSPEKFELAQRVAKVFAGSQLVPQHMRGKFEDCVIAINIADRLGEDPLVVMQNIVVVNGRPGWFTAYMIARANRSGVFKGRITWESKGSGKNLTVIARATMADTGEVVEAAVSMEMAEAEGWTKNSKYRTMPEHMLRWRAAAFLIRLYCPEVMLGLPTADEAETIDASYTEIPTPPEPPSPPAVTPPPAPATGEEAGRPVQGLPRKGQDAPPSERKPRSSKPYAAPQEPAPEPPAPVVEDDVPPEPAEDFSAVLDDIAAAQSEKDLDEVMDMHAELISRADRKTAQEIEAAHENRLAQVRPAEPAPDREQLRQAWQAGFNAFLRGCKRTLPETPFKSEERLRGAWEKGWDDAKARAAENPPAPPSPPDEPQHADAAEALAYERGKEAKGKRYSRAAVPPEYRDEAKLNLANAWKRGWDEGSLPS